MQQEIKRRHPKRRQLHQNSPFTAKIICGDCGGYYGRKVWHSNSKYCKYIWRCNEKYQNDTLCSTPNLDESVLKTAFVEAFNQVLSDKKQYIDRFEEMMPILADTSSLEEQLEDADKKHGELMKNLRRYMEENTRHIQDQGTYNRHFSELDAECKQTEKQIARLQEKIQAQSARKEQIRRCLDELRKCGNILEEFDLDLWNSMVESVTVCPDKILEFQFRDGTKIPVSMPEKTK